MPSDIKTSTTEDLRLKNHLAQIQQRYDFEKRELERSHGDEIQRVTETEGKQLDTIKKDYEVRISQEAEDLEQRLHDIRQNNQVRVETEKKSGDDELNKVRISNRKKIEEYQKNGELQLDALRKQLQASAETMLAQSRKKEKMERELASSKT